MVLLRKTSLLSLVCHTEVSPNCPAVRLNSDSNQELKIAFVYNPNEETEKIKNLKKAVNHLADNACSNQLIGKVKGQQLKAHIHGSDIGSCIVNILNLVNYANKNR